MKKATTFVMMLLMACISFSQQTNTEKPQLTKQDYLKKSKGQKTAAWILLGAGTGMMIAGGIIWGNKVEENAQNDPLGGLFTPYTTTDGTGIAAAGFIVAAGSIPLFIIAGKNKRRATSVSFKYENTQEITKGFFVSQKIPAVSLKLTL